MSGPIEYQGVTAIPLDDLFVSTGNKVEAVYFTAGSGASYPEPMVMVTVKWTKVGREYEEQSESVYAFERQHAAELLLSLAEALQVAALMPKLKES